MIERLLIGGGLLILGFYIGREVGRAEGIRQELRTARMEYAQANETGAADPPDTVEPNDVGGARTDDHS